MRLRANILLLVFALALPSAVTCLGDSSGLANKFGYGGVGSLTSRMASDDDSGNKLLLGLAIAGLGSFALMGGSGSSGEALIIPAGLVGLPLAAPASASAGAYEDYRVAGTSPSQQAEDNVSFAVTPNRVDVVPEPTALVLYLAGAVASGVPVLFGSRLPRRRC